MNIYQLMTHRIELLDGASIKCAQAGHLSMALIWRIHADQLRYRRELLTIEQVQQ